MWTVQSIRGKASEVNLGKEIESSLNEYLDQFEDNDVICYQVNSRAFAVRSKVSPVSTSGWTHVYEDDTKILCGIG